MIEVRVAPVDLDAVRALADRAERVDGFASLGEAVWRDLAAPTPQSFDVSAQDGARLVAYLHAYRGGRRPRGHRALGMVSDLAGRDRALLDELLRAALDEVPATEDAILWLPGAPPDAMAAAEDAGMHLQRELCRMVVPLPLPVAPSWPDGIDTRTFRVGEDEDTWLAVNNRAFAAHPEQGGWDEDALRGRFREPWFDPSGFLLAFDHDGLAGFCWTKQHPNGEGEIFVIGVEPARQGTGLGRALVVAGLASLAERGSVIGMLYVDAANAPAVELYEQLGFLAVRTDVAYIREARVGA